MSSDNYDAGRSPEDRRWARVVPGTPVFQSQVEGDSYAAEQYRNLAFQIEQRKQEHDERCLVVAVSSSDPGAGKTLTSLNLALTLARDGERRVLLVEGDLWKPTMGEYLDVDSRTPGMAQVLGGSATIEDSVTTVWGTGLDVVLAGETGPTTGLMAHRRLSRAVEEMRSAYEVVVIDSPPIVLASGRALASCADSVLAVVRAGQSKRRGIEEALSILGPDKVLGLVLNAARQPSDKGYAYYSGYADAKRRGPAETAKRNRRWMRIGGAVLSAVAAVALGVWLLRSDSEELPDIESLDTEAVAAAEALEGEQSATPSQEGAGTAVSDLLEGARTAADAVTRYDVSYVQLDYPGGDPGLERGNAADLIVRAFRQAGLDLQQEVHEDLLSSPGAYGASEADTSIDHRRVRSLMTYFSRNAVELGTEVDGDWQPGDVVAWSTDVRGRPNHLGVVSDRRGENGWLVIHHFKGSATGRGTEDDSLDRWPIEAHYRWTAPPGG
jgi:capsular exopolysaccharide synthesis family protein